MFCPLPISFRDHIGEHLYEITLPVYIQVLWQYFGYVCQHILALFLQKKKVSYWKQIARQQSCCKNFCL